MGAFNSMLGISIRTGANGIKVGLGVGVINPIGLAWDVALLAVVGLATRATSSVGLIGLAVGLRLGLGVIVI
jgi:hypothetical protein